MAFASINQWCTPAYIFFVVSIIFLIVLYVQNSQNSNVYCLGQFQCDVSNVGIIFILKIIYMLFWTWILNLLCRAGLSMLSWILLFLPFFVMSISVSQMYLKP